MEEKKRSCNFRPNEEMLLVTLIEKYKDIVENKKTDTISNNEKAEVWRAIEEEFNFTSKSVYRTVKILKKKYENIKKNVRKKCPNEKTNGMEIDGDPLDTNSVPLNEVEQKVKAILDARLGFVSTVDGDSESSLGQKVEEFVPIKQEPTEDQIEHHVDDDDDDDEQQHHNHHHHQQEQALPQPPPQNSTDEPGCSKWNKHRPQRLWQRRTKHLVCKTDKCFSGELINWLKAKASYEQLKKEHLILKYNLMKEKHNLEMQMLKEEHKLKMELLKINKNKLLLSDSCDI